MGKEWGKWGEEKGGGTGEVAAKGWCEIKCEDLERGEDGEVEGEEETKDEHQNWGLIEVQEEYMREIAVT